MHYLLRYVFPLKLIPWRSVRSWHCSGCGDCCKRYTVQITIQEWLNLPKTFGYNFVTQDLSGFYLGKTADGRCPFLWRSMGRILCGIQGMKPLACKIWPFRILDRPKYGRADEAHFNYRNRDFYVYLVPRCVGINWGKPSEHLVKIVIPEFIDVKLGLQKRQLYSTALR